jgi:ATP-binding cassette, subfamily B, heavy metal transporter
MPPDTINSSTPRDAESWATLRRFLPYLWPTDAPQLKLRIVGAMSFVLASKLTQVFLIAFALKVAVDVMAAGDRSRGWFVVAVVAGYAAARFSTTLFDNLRNVSSNASGRSRPGCWRRVFRHLHNLSLRFHSGTPHRRGHQGGRARDQEHRYDAVFPAVQHRARPCWS